MEHAPTKDYYEWLCRIFDELGWERELKSKAGTVPENVNVLEVGAAWGVSTHCFFERSFVNKLTTVDIAPCPRATEEIIDIENQPGKHPEWDFRQGDSKIILTQLEKESYDFVYIDGDHSEDGAYKDMVNGWELLKPGGWMVMDDVLHKKNGGPDSGFNVGRALWKFIYDNKLQATLYPSWTGFAVIKKPL